MDNLPLLGTCPYCKTPVRSDRLDNHVRIRCRKAPSEIITARDEPPQLVRRKVKGRKAKRGFRTLSGTKPRSASSLKKCRKDPATEFLKAQYIQYIKTQREAMSD